MIEALLTLARVLVGLGLMVVFAWAISVLLFPEKRP